MMSVMICAQFGIIYLLLFTIMLPFTMCNSCETDKLLVDILVNVTCISAALSQVCYAIFTASERNNRMFVSQKRRCVSDMFS